MYVDEMWLECMQGRAMQDVLAAKATKKRPPRRPLGEITNRPSTPIAVAVPPTPPAALPKRPAPRRPEAKAEARPLATPRPDTIVLVEDHAETATPLPTTEATDEADVAASHEIIAGLSQQPNTTAQRGLRLAVRACVLAVVVAASASAGSSLVHAAKAPATEPVRPRAKFAWAVSRSPMRPPRWAFVQGVAPSTTSRAAHMDSLARFLAAARGVVHKLPPPPPPRSPAFAWTVRPSKFPAGPARRVVPP